MTAAKQLKRRARPGALLRSLGHASWAAEQTSRGIDFLGGHEAPFSAWAGPAQISSTLGFTTIQVPLAGGTVARLAGVTTHDAASFISSANAAFRAYFLQQFAPCRLPARPASQMRDKTHSLPETIPDGVLTEDQQRLITTVRTFQAAPEEARQAAIAFHRLRPQ